MLGNKSKTKSMRFFIGILIIALTITSLSALPSSASPEQDDSTVSSEAIETVPNDLMSTDPEVNADGGLLPQNQEVVTETAIKGIISYPDSIAKIMVNIYDSTKYIEDNKDTKIREDASNEIITSAAVKSGKEFEVGGLEKGQYRLEFICEDKDFDPSLYELDKKANEQKEIKYEYTTEEAFFLHTDITLEDESNIEFSINEIEKIKEEKNNESNSKIDSVSNGTPTGTAISNTAIDKDNATAPAVNEGSKDDQAAAETKIRESKDIDLSETKITAEDLGIKPLSVKELSRNASDVVGATLEEDGTISGLFNMLRSMVTGSDWAFDIYYVGENDRNHVEKTDDFTLKYQMEFHNSRALEENEVEIRIPINTFTYREGNLILPTDIAIPMGTPTTPTPTPVSPFNYYRDGNDLVFFNYEPIKSGSNAAWQVMYKNLIAMDIKDETRWSFKPVIKVRKTDGTWELRTPDPLTGRLNTEVNLNVVTKEADTLPGKSYGPELYTRNQVETYAGPLTGDYSTNFNNYVFILWNVSVTGNATQPWNLKLNDTSNPAGKVVSIRENYTRKYTPITGGGTGDQTILTYQKQKEIKQILTGGRNHTYSVVMAYPKTSVQEGTVVTNTITAILEPYDKQDPVQRKSASAKWSYKNYVWRYGGNYDGLRKYTPQNSYTKKEDQMKGWLTVYDGCRKKGVDKGDLTYNTNANSTVYGFTHITTGDDKGKRIPNTSAVVTTVDDYLYAHSSNAPLPPIQLTDKDYYFNGITVNINDHGYDVYEDTYAAPEPGSKDAQIYFMYPGSNNWTLAKTIAYEPNMSYTFKKDELTGQPYRVKVVFETVNYSVNTNIKVSVALRKNSPVMGDLMASDPASITIQNLSGTYGYSTVNGVPQSYINWQEKDFNYEQYPPELAKWTKDQYKNLIVRDCATIDVTKLKEMSDASKTAKVTNDADNGRANVRYNLTAHDGYELYSKDGVNDLKTYVDGIISPGRNEVMFYDLLPYGVQFDPTKEIYAGRTTNMIYDENDGGTRYTEQPALWDSTQVTATVTKVITDYRGTGRTYVAFKLTYSGADPTYYTGDKTAWLEGWGISFGAYYSWKNIDIVDAVENICAFMGADNVNPILGMPQRDNGTYPEGFEKDYKDFGKDIDYDGREDDTVLYAKSKTSDNIAVASTSLIEKLVRADADAYADFAKQAEVASEGLYTYDITLYNALGTAKDIVIFDRIENAIVDRQEQEPGKFENGDWKGTFRGLQLRALDDLGIKYTVYYSTNRNATLPNDTEHPSVALSNPEWVKAASYSGSLSNVKAFAIVLEKDSKGNDFTLEPSDSVSFQVKMTAPESSTNTWAYNNPSFSRYLTGVPGEDERHFVVGDSVKVRLDGAGTLEVKKELEKDTPAPVQDTEFEFVIRRDGSVLRNIEYELHNYVNGSWVKSDKIYSTDAEGKFYLTGDQKAVFKKLVGIDRVTIVESKNPFWAPSVDTKSETNNFKTVTYTNKYQPILFVQKILENVPKDVDPKNDTFIFKLTSNGEPVANKVFYYVDRVRTDGGIPTIIDEGKTDDKGEFHIKAGQIIALLPGDAGTNYTVKEVGGAGDKDRWFVENDEVSGVLNIKGSRASITNYYKYKNLLLTKEITNQDPAKATNAEFTFKVTDKNGDPVIGNTWVVLNADGTESTDIRDRGTLNSNGEFTCRLAGKTVKIKGLIANEKYTVEETASGTLYEALNGGIVQVTMPKYGENKDATITNDYLKRPLSVTKHVLYDLKDKTAAAAATSREFTMTVKVDGKLLTSKPYDIYEGGKKIGSGTTTASGTFKIKHGQTVTFPDVGMKYDSYEVIETYDTSYPQIYPEDRKSHTGQLVDPKNNVTFINGKSGSLILEKLCVNNDGTPFIDDAIRSQNTKKFKMTLEVTDSIHPTPYLYPDADKVVDIIKPDGTASTMPWMKGQPLEIEPSTKVIITGLPEGATYRFTEAESDQKYIFTYNGKYVQVKQMIPEDYGSVAGTVKGNPIAQITNGYSSIDPNGSEIIKSMKAGSNPIPVGSKLIWKVEEFDGKNWVAKEGVPYYTFDSDGITCAEELYSDYNGYITMTKTANGYPRVKFTKDTVKLNVTTGSIGDLRVVEVMSESDNGWGYLSGYRNGDEKGLNVTGGNMFINSNLMNEVEIAKNYDGAENETFTFILEQIMRVAKDPIESEKDILETIAHGGIPYTIYDQKTNDIIGYGATNVNGEIVIKGGQYAKVGLPNDTYWTIREKVVKPYRMTGLDVSGDGIFTVPDNDNLAVIHPVADVKAEPIVLTKDMVQRGVIDADTGQRVNIKSGDVVIPSYIIEGDKLYYIVATADATGYGIFADCNITSLVLPDTLERIGNRTFVYHKEITGNLVIPENVTSIGMNAFEGCTGFTDDLIIPDKVITIEDSAFRNCTGFNGVLTLGEELQIIGSHAFRGCTEFIGDLEIPNNVLSIGHFAFAVDSGYNAGFKNGKLILGEKLIVIGSNAFYKCTGFTGDLEIPASVTTINNNAFEGCTGFNGTLTLNDGLKVLDNYAFNNCSGFTGSLRIPTTLDVISNYVFEGCNGFTGTLTIPKQIQVIGYAAFRQCKGFEALVFEGATDGTSLLTKIDGLAFNGSNGFRGRLILPQNLVIIGTQAFYQSAQGPSTGTFSGTLTIPASVRTIDNSAFYMQYGITSLVIEEGVETIGYTAFAYMSRLTGEVTIPSTVKTMGTNVFTYGPSSYINLSKLIIKKQNTSPINDNYPWGLSPTKTQIVWQP